jgi:hypothetical protein
MRMARHIKIRNQNHRRKDIGDQTYKSISKMASIGMESMSGKK